MLRPVTIDELGPRVEGNLCQMAVRFQSKTERAITEQITTPRALLGALADSVDVLSGPAGTKFRQGLDTLTPPKTPEMPEMPEMSDAQTGWLHPRAILMPGG